MVRSRGCDDTSKGRGELSRGRGKSALPLGQQKTITTKATADRGRGADLSETSSYVPSREASEGHSASVQEQSTVQSRPQGRYQLRDEPSSSHSTSKKSESASQVSEPSSTPVPKAHEALVQDIPDDGRGGDATTAGLERLKKKEVSDRVDVRPHMKSAVAHKVVGTADEMLRGCLQTMVRSRGRGDTSKGRGGLSRGRGKSALPLGQQKKIIMKATTGRGRGAYISETSSYVPSREASEGNSAYVQEHPTVQSRPQERYQLRDEPSSSHNTSEESESASQASEPSATPVLEAHEAPVQDIPNDGRWEYTTTVGLERSKKKEVSDNVDVRPHTKY
ncbi:uncharacterized protein [Nicotiana tomentosiformis]|nr:uncharacterized protein LOC104102585 isoform X2 [Nicotiana tomentosiformis]